MYRNHLERFVNWVKDRIQIYLKLPDVTVGFTEFKMADDIQRKQLVIQLNAANKISDHTMLTELGFDYDEELKTIRSETEDRNQINTMMMKAQTEAQGEAQILQAKYSAKAEEANLKARQASELLQQQDQMQMQPGQEQGQEQGPGPGPGGADFAADTELAAGSPSGSMGGDQPSAGGQVINMDAKKIAMQYANRISKVDPAQRQAVLADLQRKMPSMYRLVLQILQQMSYGETAAQGQEKNKPLPTKRPPRREGGPV